ncbi:MAG TPA: RDD family protein [Solirubrobacteraceae bacterium]
MSATERPYAGIVSRAVALAVDAGLLTAGFAVASGVFGLILSLFTAVEVSSPGAVLGAAGLWSLVVAGYFVLFWTLAGETPGMRLMALRVIDARGDPPGFGRALVRLAGMILAAIPFFAGYLLILVDDRRRGLQDVLAGTTVVYAPQTSVPGPAPAQRVGAAG